MPDTMRKVYIIGIIGAVASGKSTLAQNLFDALRTNAQPMEPGTMDSATTLRSTQHDKGVTASPHVGQLANLQHDGSVPSAQYLVLPPITTDNFLYSNETMEEMGILGQKGAPHTHKEQNLREFIENLRNSSIPLSDILLPKYSHTLYNIIGQQNLLDAVNYDYDALARANTLVVILEGVGVSIVRDLLDAYIYYDVSIEVAYKRYLARTLSTWQAGKLDAESWYHQFSTLTTDEFTERAKNVWESVNLPNYRNYILPERGKADYILHGDQAPQSPVTPAPPYPAGHLHTPSPYQLWSLFWCSVAVSIKKITNCEKNFHIIAKKMKKLK